MSIKFIYKIQNIKNGKVYIGQSVHPEKRWAEHKKNKKSLIGRTMQQEGIENFTFSIIEQVENYTKRENYWIDFYNSIENGYNINKAVFSKTSLANNCLSKDKVERIENLLLTTLTYEDIMKLEECASETITKINRGQHLYSSKNKIFPLSNRANQYKYKEDIIVSIIEDLQFTELTIKQIAEKYKIKNHDKISEINLGKHCKCPKNYHYPIRPKNFNKTKLSLEQIWEIENLLINTSFSKTKIAKMYNVHNKTIDSINHGLFKGTYIHNLQYPLRENV